MCKKNKILIDLGSFSVTPYTGVGQVAIQYMEQLARHKPSDIEFYLLLKKGTKSTLFSPSFPIQYSESPNTGILNKLINKSYQREYTPKVNFQLRHSLIYVASSPQTSEREPLIITIHDANPLVLNSGKKSKFFYRMEQAINSADILVFISHYARDVVSTYFDLSAKKTTIIYNGVSHQADNNELSPNWLQRKNEPLLVFVGRVVPAKNIHLLIEMMRWLPDFTLVIAGNLQQDPVYTLKLRALIWKLRLSSKVILAGKISELDKGWLFAHCSAVVLPSRAEGFGLPVIEAFHHGKPVFISDLTALPEIGGDQAYYWHDLEPESMAKVVSCTLGDSEINSEKSIAQRIQRAQYFSWENNATSYCNLYKNILSTP